MGWSPGPGHAAVKLRGLFRPKVTMILFPSQSKRARTADFRVAENPISEASEPIHQLTIQFPSTKVRGRGESWNE